MTKFSKAIVFVVALLLPCASVFAQLGTSTTSDKATTTAIIVAPLTITTSADLHFGAMLSPTSSGTATVSPSGGWSGSGVLQANGSPTVSAAEFDVVGVDNAVVYITLPASSYYVSNGTIQDDMEVKGFTSNHSSGNLTLDINGEGTIKVGATLYLAANQPEGTYTNAAGLEVTISY